MLFCFSAEVESCVCNQQELSSLHPTVEDLSFSWHQNKGKSCTGRNFCTANVDKRGSTQRCVDNLWKILTEKRLGTKNQSGKFRRFGSVATQTIQTSFWAALLHAIENVADVFAKALFV